MYTAYFLFPVILNDSEGSHNLIEEYMLRAFSGGLPRSLRSLAMTLLFYLILNGSEESHRRTDGYMYFFTLVVGYFACAQYDLLFIPYRHFVPLPPKEEANHRLCERSEANSREGGGLRSMYSVLFRWDISLALNMTYFFISRHSER